MKWKDPECRSTTVRVDWNRNMNVKLWALKHINIYMVYAGVKLFKYIYCWRCKSVMLTSVFYVFISALRFGSEVRYWSWSFLCCCNWHFPIAVSSSFFLASFSYIMKGPCTEPCCKSLYLKNKANLTCLIWGCMYVISVSNFIWEQQNIPQVLIFLWNNISVMFILASSMLLFS